MLNSPLLFAQSPTSAAVQFSDGQIASISDFSQAVAIQPNELVDVTLQFDAGSIGNVVTLKASDGAAVSTGSSLLVIGPEGKINFAFRAANTGAISSVEIQSTNSSTLTFSVSDSAQQ